MKVLVTGARGRVGRVLVPTLTAAGHDVRALDTTAPGDAEPPDPYVDPGSGSVEEWTGDQRDHALIRDAVDSVDAVVHGGALPRPHDDERLLLDVNVAGTWNVLLACVEAGCRRVVYFSSINALGVVGGYGDHADYLPFDDAHPPRPRNAYQLSKLLSEEACRSYSARFDLTTVCLRPVYVSAPERDYSHWRRPGHQMPGDWVWQEFAAYVDTRDVARAVLLGLTVDPDRLTHPRHDAFLLAADDTGMAEPTADLVAQHLPDTPWRGRLLSEWVADAPNRALVDTSHARDVLGWVPKHSWRTAN